MITLVPVEYHPTIQGSIFVEGGGIEGTNGGAEMREVINGSVE